MKQRNLKIWKDKGHKSTELYPSIKSTNQGRILFKLAQSSVSFAKRSKPLSTESGESDVRDMDMHC